MSAYESLPPWQQHFVDLYVEGAHAPNPTAAYRIARPSVVRPDVAASKLMSKPEIRAAIDERLRRQREHCELNEQWVLERLQTIAERCMQPVFDSKGGIKRMLTDATNATRALELLGRHFAMWTDKHAGPDGGPLRVVQVVKFFDDEDDDDVVTTVNRDGSVSGPLPVTLRRNLGSGGYGT